MITTSELIENFPVDPALPIVFIAYNEDMVPAIEEMIIETHGREYFDNYVTVIGANTAGARDITFNGPSAIYLDPNFYRYHNNGYN